MPIVDFCNNKGRSINDRQIIYITQKKYCDLLHIPSPSLDAIVIMHSSLPYLLQVNSLASKLKFNMQYVRIHSQKTVWCNLHYSHLIYHVLRHYVEFTGTCVNNDYYTNIRSVPENENERMYSSQIFKFNIASKKCNILM